MSPGQVEGAVAALTEALAATLGLLGPVAEVVVRFQNGRELALPAPGSGGEAAPLTPTEAAIVAAMRGRPPAKQTVIAARAGQVYDSNFRRRLKGLRQRGLVEADPGTPHLYRLRVGP